MTGKSTENSRITTDSDGESLTVYLDGAPIATVDLMHGASPEARAALERHGLDLTALVAAAWGED